VYSNTLVIGKAAGKLRICERHKGAQLLARNCDNQYMAEEEDKQKGQGAPPPAETILATEQERDPDEAVFAEQAIHAYANQCLDQFRDSVQTALDAFMAWVESQQDAQTFDNTGFSAQMGDVFRQQMLQACGGRDTPIGAAMFEQLDSYIDQQARDEHEASFFVTALASGARDFTWYLRDNLQAVLGNQWDQLRDLAYEGSTDFIPALHAFGMPRMDWTAGELQQPMIALAEKTRESQPKTQEEALDKDPKQEEEEKQQLLVEEAEKAQAV
jgi:hypothetical protein